MTTTSVWEQILKVEREGGIPSFPGAFVDWDNTARLREARAHLPQRVTRTLRALVPPARRGHRLPGPIRSRRSS
jgi:hypothetical protein